MGKYKQTIKHFWEKGLVHIFAGSFLTKCIAFFGSIVLVNVLSKTDYGILSYYENFYGYVWVLAGMGMSNAILRFVVLQNDLKGKQDYFLYSVRRGFFFNLLLIALAAAVNVFFPHKYEYRDYSWLLFILLISLPFQYIADNSLNHERAMFENKRYVLFSLILSCGIITTKILSGKLFGIRGAVISQALTYILLGAAFFISSSRKHYGALKLHCNQPIENEKEVNTYSFQYMITNGLWAIFMLNDTFLLGRFCAAETLAEYRVAYTIPGCVSMISASIGIYVGPYFVKNENDRDWVKSNYKKAFIATAALVGLVCLGIGVLAKPVIWVLYRDRYMNVVPLMRILLIAAFCNCGLRYTTANILAAMGQIKYNMVVSAIGTALQIAINLFVIPRYASFGVAVTSCVVYSFMAVSLFIVFYRKYYWISN